MPRARRSVRAARRHAIATLALALLAGGCFGDWVRAKKRPQRDELPEPVKSEPLAEEGPDHPCLALQGEIASLCEGLLSGRVERASCYAELLRFSAKPAIPDEKDRLTDRYTKREASCRGDLRSLEKQRAESEGRTLAELGPVCSAWADELRERCLQPLALPDPQVPTRCGGWFMSMKSVVEGRAERREDACARAQAAAHAKDEAVALPDPPAKAG
jgi:hypothetical protein